MFFDHHPDDIREAADMYGLDPRQLAQPMEHMFAGGLAQLSTYRHALAKLLKFRQGRERELLREKFPGDPENGIFEKLQAEHDAQAERAREPLWKIISGIGEAVEFPQLPRERRRALTIVVNAAEMLIRHELEFAESDESAIARSLSFMDAASEATAPSLLKPRQRSIYWTPLHGICAALGLSRVALTRFGQELVGRSAHELVDDIVAENVHRKMAEKLHPKLRTILRKEFGAQWDKNLDGITAREVWKKIKAERVEPEFNRVAWAQQFGFPNYNRLNRSCLSVHGMSPHQIELQVIEEFLEEVRKQERQERQERQGRGAASGSESGSGNGSESGNGSGNESESVAAFPSSLRGEGRASASERGDERTAASAAASAPRETSSTILHESATKTGQHVQKNTAHESVA